LAFALQDTSRPENGDDRRRVRPYGVAAVSCTVANCPTCTTPAAPPTPWLERRKSAGRRRADMAAKVPCPHCGSSASLVTNTRPVLPRNGVKRRRECEDCGHRFTTIETLYDTAA
jgi:hypothetical protein